MKIGYLGAGVWGYCLASLLSSKGYKVVSWTPAAEVAEHLNKTKLHPLLKSPPAKGDITFTTNLAEALDGIDLLVESVTSAGLRPVCEQVKALRAPDCPMVITSKGIEQNTGLILPEVAVQVLGEKYRPLLGCLSGPSYAEEVAKGLPTSVVSSSFSPEVMHTIAEAFNTLTFRVYPNADILGVAYGAALKNVIAIACGMSDGLGLGSSSKAALMTRGLHEIRKLATSRGCKAETLYGLSGMGDLCLTCSSSTSRNYRFGYFIAQGMTVEEAQKKIGMVVEGAYSCISALQISQKLQIPMPITESVHKIVYEKMHPTDAVIALMQRTIKEEHL